VTELQDVLRIDQPGGLDWWGSFALDEGLDVLAWRIGPLILQARYWPQEWRLAWRHLDDPQDTAQDFARLAEMDETDCRIARFGLREAGRALALRPRLADRSVVVRPDTQLFIPPGEECLIYVSTPAWVEVTTGNGLVLAEVPTYRPSDSWFGPDTRDGELCYASRTLARLRIEDVVPRPHRIVSPVTVRNRGADALQLERVSVPVRLLPLYATARHQLWTQPLVMERTADGKQGALKLEELKLPAELQVRRVADAREVAGRRGLLQTIDRLFG
jgi:hypothetical protein